MENIFLIEGDKSVEEFILMSTQLNRAETTKAMTAKGITFKDNLIEYFKKNPVVYCERCFADYRVGENSKLYTEVLEKIDSYPYKANYEKCCEPCREEEANYYNLVLMVDEWMEYELADKQWFWEEACIEKRWKISRAELSNKIKELKEKMPNVSVADLSVENTNEN